MNNTKYNEESFLRVYNYFIENADVTTFKDNYKNYFKNLLKEFFVFYNDSNYVILESEEDKQKTVKIHDEQLDVIFKNRLNKMYISLSFNYNINCFSTLKENIKNVSNKDYIIGFETEIEFYKNMVAYINHKSIEVEKQELNYLFIVKENEIKSKELKYKRDLDLYRVNSGNFTEYELSTMYTVEELNRLRKRL